MATSRSALRLWVGEILGDVKSLTATAVGTTTTFIDLKNNAVLGDSLTGRILYFTGPVNNLGLERRITGNTESTGTLTFAAVTTAPALADTAELWNDRNTGVIPSTQVHNFINRAIAAVERLFLTEVSAEYAFKSTTPAFALAQSTWIAVVQGAEWKDGANVWHHIPSADVRVDRANRTVEIRNTPRDLADGRTVRLRGYTAAGALTSDTAETSVNAEYVATQAAAWLLAATWHKRSDARDAKQQAGELQARADVLRPAASLTPIANTVMLS